MFLVILCKTLSLNYGMRFVLLSSFGMNLIVPSHIAGFPYEKVRERTLYLQVLDYDRFSRNDPIGEVSVPLNKVELGQLKTFWKDLKPCIDGSVSHFPYNQSGYVEKLHKRSLCRLYRLTLMALFPEKPLSPISFRLVCVCVVGKSWRSAVVSVL